MSTTGSSPGTAGRPAASGVPRTGPGQAGVPGKRRRDRAAREREILDAAERIFGDRGYQGASMDEIAAEVGVSKPLIYQYYGSKDGLFLACLSRLRAHLLDAVSAAVLAAPGPEEAMYAGFVAWFQFLDDHPRAWSVIVDEGILAAGQGGTGRGRRQDQGGNGWGRRQDAAARAADEVRADFVELIATMVRLNLPPARPVDADEIAIVAQTISGATERLAIWRARAPNAPSPEKTARTLQDLFWQGLHTWREG